MREKEKVAGALFFSAPLPNGILLLCRGEEGNRDWQTTFSISSLSSGLEWKWGKFFSVAYKFSLSTCRVFGRCNYHINGIDE